MGESYSFSYGSNSENMDSSDSWDPETGYSSDISSIYSNGDSDESTMDSDRNSSSETTHSSDYGEVIEDMEHESVEPGILNNTEWPGIEADERRRDSSKTTLYTNTVSATRETSLIGASSSRDLTRTGVVSMPTQTTIEKFFNHTVSRRSTAHDAGAPTRPVGNGDMITRKEDITSSSDHASNVAAALVVIPSVAFVFVLLLFVFLILLWKKSFNRRWSRRDSVRSRGSDIKEEVGEVDQNLANPRPKESQDLLHHTTDPNEDMEVTLGGQSTICEVQYAEVDENVQTIVDGNIPPNGHSSYEKMDTERHGYADSDLRETQNYDGNDSDDDAAEKEMDGYKTTKITDPVDHSLDPDAHSDSSYISVSRSKQNGYDHLETQQNQHQTIPRSDSGYDLTERIGKNDAKLVSSNTTESGYSVLCSDSANTTAYDKLDHTRSYDVNKSSP